jgi:hypothetical protein
MPLADSVFNFFKIVDDVFRRCRPGQLKDILKFFNFQPVRMQIGPVEPDGAA